MSDEKALSAQQTRAIVLLLAGRSQRDVAAAIGVTEQTLSRWQRKDTPFSKQLASSLKTMMSASLVEVLTARAEAIKLLRTIINTTGPHSTADRIRAAKIILSAATAVRFNAGNPAQERRINERFMRLFSFASFAGSTPVITTPPEPSEPLTAALIDPDPALLDPAAAGRLLDSLIPDAGAIEPPPPRKKR